MKKWTTEDIKMLRLRLGWSAAEFSRHFGCLADLILAWERGSQIPSPDDELQLERLDFHSESYCEQVLRAPAADRLLRQMQLTQICQTDIHSLNKNS